MMINTHDLEIHSARQLLIQKLANILNQQNVSDSELRCTAHNILYAVAIGLSLPAGIPFMRLANDFGKDHQPYGYFLAAGTDICYASVCFWSYMNLIDEIFQQNEQLDVLLQRTQKQKILQWVIPVIFGMGSAVPALYLAYNSNNHEIVWPIIDMLSAFGYRVLGFYSGFNLIRNQIYKPLFGQRRDIIKMRNAIADRLQQIADSISTINAAPFSEDFTPHGQLTHIDVEQLIACASFPEMLRQTKFSNLQKSMIKYGKFIGCLFPLAQIILNFVLAEKTFNKIVPSSAISTPIVLIMLFPDAALMMVSAAFMIRNVLTLAFSVWNHSDFGQNILFYNFRIAFTLQLMALMIAAFSYGANASAIKNNLTESMAKTLLPIFILSDTIFHIYVLSNNFSRIVEWLTQSFESDEKKIILSKAKKLAHLGKLVGQMPENEFATLAEPTATNIEMGNNLLRQNRPLADGSSALQANTIFSSVTHGQESGKLLSTKVTASY